MSKTSVKHHSTERLHLLNWVVLRGVWIILIILPLTMSGRSVEWLFDSIGATAEYNLKTFPFELLEFDFAHPTKIDSLEALRRAVTQRGFDGDRFLMYLFEYHIATDSVNVLDLEKIRPLLTTGELFYRSGFYLPDSLFVYRAIGDLYLSTIADSLRAVIDRGAFHRNSTVTNYVHLRLVDNQYGVDVPISNFDKAIGYIQSGRIDYVFRKMLGTYQHITWIALVVLISIVTGLYFLYKQFRQKKKL